jgi:uncharacterized repeat protein (TIGR01451 family)
VPNFKTLLASVFGMVLAGFAVAQSPAIPPQRLPLHIVSPGDAEPITDPNVEPVQRLEPPIPGTIPDRPTGPTVPTGVVSTAPRAGAVVTDPPTPTVQLKIRTPAHVAPGKPVPVKIQVVNNSGATAYRVQVRVPFPEGAAAVAKSEPVADGQTPATKELVWKFKQLAKGEQKTIDLEFTAAATAKEVQTRAYVSFEHGAEVVTALDKPKLAVKKTATPQMSVNELATVRVEVANTGNVTIPNARLVENVSPGAEFRGDRDSEKGESASQRIWQLGDLGPGQAKIVTYQILGKNGGELVTTSIAASSDATASVQSEKAETKTKVLVPALKFEFSGPPTVEANRPAQYTATVSNSGTQPLTDVRVTVTVPDDCEVTKMTNGGRRTKESVLWIVPSLPAGESRSYRVSLEAQTSGRKSIKAGAREPRTQLEETKEVVSMFQGKADLTWAPSLDQVVLSAGRQGTVTIKVRNQGGETEKALRVRLELPEQVKFVQATPNAFDLAKNELVFKPRAIAPGQQETFTITYEAKSSGRAYFRMRLEADSLGDRPLLKEQAVEINNAK